MAYEDLLKDSSFPLDNKNYFNLTITDLNISTLYPLEFRWKYEDGSFGPWSAVKSITTPAETAPSTPNLGVSDVVGGNGYIKITWNGNDSNGNPIQNIDRVNIHISGGTFGIGTQVVDFFKTAGVKTIVAAPGTYIVQLKAITVSGSTSFFSLSRTVDVVGTENVITNPEDPSTPTASAGKSTLLVAWDGKNSSNTDFTAGSFFGAKVYVGTTSTFTPSDNNWVHTLNFANGYNQVSIPVGTVINKSTSLKLEYNTNYYVKIGTLNQNFETTGNFISASGTPVNISYVNPDELGSGILRADSYVQAGPTNGQKVILSGGAEPFAIYGSDGTTKLLSFQSQLGGVGKLSIIGSGTFTGDISAATGTLTNALNIGTSSGGLYPFSVSSSGVLRAISGTIGGLTLAADGIQNSSGSFKIDTDGKARFGSGPYIDISPTLGIYHSAGTFSLSPSGTLSLTGTITALNGGSIGGWTVSGNTLTGGNITLNAGSGKISIGNTAASHIELDNTNGIRHMNNTAATGNFTLSTAGDLSIKGTIEATSGYIGTSSSGWYVDSIGIRNTQYLGSADTFFYSPRSFSDNDVVLQIGSTANFSVTKAGVLRAQNAEISGTLVANQVAINPTNYWNSSSFNVSAASLSTGTINLEAATITDYADDYASGDAENDLSGIISSNTVVSSVILNSSGVSIKNIPALRGVTSQGLSLTASNTNNYLYKMGKAARQRMLVQDPYDKKVYRGLAVYYGARTSTPGAGTGHTGDLWVSWS